MTKAVIIGAGNIGLALAAFLGARPELSVALWSRRFASQTKLSLTAYGVGGTYAIGAAIAEPSLRRAVEHADVALIAVPTHLRWRVLKKIAERLNDCALVVAWEGTGRFREELQELSIDRPIVVGLQRSPILCRMRNNGSAVEILGVRTRVVGATTRPSDRTQAKRLLSNLLPFPIALAPTYMCVSISPGNPLMHPARIYSFDRAGLDLSRDGTRFYADWNDAASEVLLSLHTEVARLRDTLHLPLKYLRTLADCRNLRLPSDITRELRSEKSLSEFQIPIQYGYRGVTLDKKHRYFREDIGEGLAYILEIANRVGVELPTAQAIFQWYRGRVARKPRNVESRHVADHSLR